MTEVFQHFRIMMPKPENVMLLVELLRRKENDGDGMTSEEIIGFFHSIGVHGYEEEKLHTAERDAYQRAKKKRVLLNRMNRGYLRELEEQGYVERRWQGRNFSDPGHEGGGAYCVRERARPLFAGVRGQVVPVAGAYYTCPSRW